MATQYTPILQLALPVTGEINGTWGDVVNDNITSMVEQAIAGLATINTWTANSHTLTTANGTTDEARCAMLVAQTGAGGTALTAAGEIICPARTKLYVLSNASAYTVTLKTAAGSGVAVPAGDTTFLFCDGTNVNACVTQIVNGHITGNLTVDGNTTLGNATSDTITAIARIASDLNPSADNTYDLGTSGNSWRNLYIDGTATIATLNVTTIDTTNIEVTNIKAKDGTAAITLADSTGVATLSAAPVLNAGTANQVQYLNGSKQLVGDADFTFDGTTLSATNITSSGSVTLSGGTANSIPYLNGSKVLTTGSSLTFDGTGLGVGTTSPSSYAGSVVSYKASGASWLVAVSGSSQLYAGIATGQLPSIQSNGDLMFAAGAGFNEQMRLTSTGLGIGTSSISYGAAGRGNITLGGSASGILGFQIGGVAKGYVGHFDSNMQIWNDTNTPILFATNSAERMRIDSSGNLGLGVTPSAWGSGFKAFDIGAGSTLVNAGSNTQTWLTSNSYYNAGWKYKNTAQASYYEQSLGAHAWFTAPSGTTGNAISFTQAMTLDANGNLALGSTSASGNRLLVQVAGGSPAVNVTDGVASDFVITPGVSSGVCRVGPSVGATAFYTSNTERMRIDSSGNVLVGTTASDGKVTVYSASSTIVGLWSGVSTAVAQVGFRNPNGYVGSISTSGSSTSYNTSSDYRLKENIQPMQNALDVVAQLNPVTYNWKADGSDGQGFIAHELQAVVPDAVTGEKDAVDEEGKPVYQGIDTSFLVATLTKAIQEQQEQINQLKAEVAALKQGN